MSKDPENRERTWELVQKKAFTAWVNSYLERRNMKITDLQQDFSDGVKLINFLEVLSNKQVKNRYDAKPKMRVQCIENIHIGLLFLTNELGIRLVSIGAEDFVDCNLKLVLGFLWTLFRKFRTELAAEASGVEKTREKEALLQWVSKTIADVPGAPSSVHDFKSSFADGLVFLALIHKFDSNVVPGLDKYKGQPALENLLEAFDLAEKHLGVPKLIDAQELIDGTVDERSMLLYVSLYFHAFASAEERRRLEGEKARLAGQLQDLETSRASAEAAKKELEKKNLELVQMEETLKGDLASTSSRIEELEQEIQRNKSEIERSKKELAEYNQQRDQELKTLAEEIENLKNKLLKEHADKNELTDKESFLNEKLEVLKQLLEAESSDNDASQKVNEQLEAQLTEAQAKEAERAKVLGDAKAVLDGVLSAKHEVETEYNSVKESLEGEAKKLQATHSEVSSKREQLQNTLDELQRKQALESRGLGLLRDNIQEHLNDLVKWRPYLNQEKEEDGEPIELTKFDFGDKTVDEQLGNLAKAVDTRNSKLETMIKEKEAAKAEEAALQQQKQAENQ